MVGDLTPTTVGDFMKNAKQPEKRRAAKQKVLL